MLKTLHTFEIPCNGLIEEDISIALPSVEAYPLLLGWGGHRHPVYILSLCVLKEY